MYNLDYHKTRAALVEAFKELRKENLVARMNFSCCMSCASYELGQMVEKKDAAGAVYWHRQDNDGFKECGELHLRYFSASGTEAECAEIGRKVQTALGRHKIPSVWDGSPHHTIQVFCHGGF